MTYSPPHVSVTELTSPTGSPIISDASVVAVVGRASGSVRATAAVTLTGTTAVAIPGFPTGASMVSIDADVVVKDSYLVPENVPATYNTSTGYGSAEFTFDPSAKTIARVSSGGSGSAGASLIPSGETVYVTYDYLPADYFVAANYTDLSEIEEKYGAALNSDRTAVNSPVTFAALNAFQGGARTVCVAPLFKRTSAGDPDSVRLQASAAESATTAPWTHTLYALRDAEDVNLIVPAIGQSSDVSDANLLAIFQEVYTHMRFMQDQYQYIYACFGEDSTTDSAKATKATIRSHASTLAGLHGGSLAEQTFVVNTAKFPLEASQTGTTYVGGQYQAAKIAGMLAGAKASESLTRNVVPGLTGVADYRSRQDKLTDGEASLLVLDERNNNVIIRHAISLDDSSSARHQISVVRAKHQMIESVRDTLETRVIGKSVSTSRAAVFVASTVQGVLEDLKADGTIDGFSAISARLLSGDPTTVEVRFDYLPIFALDYINIRFSLNLTTQTATVG